MIPRNKQTESEIKKSKIDRVMSGVNAWASFYRANPHRFAHDYLGLTLDRFQQIILCMMFKFANLIYLASRGGGKSFLMAVFCCTYCILYPDSRICLASKTRKQATEIIDKVREILLPKSANLRLEIAEIQVNQANAYISFKNGSRVVVVTATESARHNRATVLLVDEFRMVDKNTIDTVLRKFLTSQRHPAFLDKPEYKDYPKEKVKELYASSCWYESHWSYELVRSYVVNMIRGRSYFCCSMPYQLAIEEGRLDRTKVEDEMSETTFSSTVFQMEMEALFFGQGNGGLYSFDEIDKNRRLLYPLFPKNSDYKLTDKKLQLPPKLPGEIRIISADIALMSSTRFNNDATSIFVNQMLPIGGDRYVNNIIFAKNDEGLRTDVQALRIRKLFEEYQGDYLVLDATGLGLGVVDAIMGDIFDTENGVTYQALSCCNNEEIASRCSVKNAPKKIYAVKGNAEFNSQCALGLREALKQGQVKLLVSEYDAEELLGSIKGYSALSVSEALDYKLPYIHTSLLINELVNLEYEARNNVVRVKEKPGMRKDRYSSLSYNIYVAKILEREKALSNQKKPIEDLVFGFRAPKIKKN